MNVLRLLLCERLGRQTSIFLTSLLNDIWFLIYFFSFSFHSLKRLLLFHLYFSVLCLNSKWNAFYFFWMYGDSFPTRHIYMCISIWNGWNKVAAESHQKTLFLSYPFYALTFKSFHKKFKKSRNIKMLLTHFC